MSSKKKTRLRLCYCLTCNGSSVTQATFDIHSRKEAKSKLHNQCHEPKPESNETMEYLHNEVFKLSLSDSVVATLPSHLPYTDTTFTQANPFPSSITPPSKEFHSAAPITSSLARDAPSGNFRDPGKEFYYSLYHLDLEIEKRDREVTNILRDWHGDGQLLTSTTNTRFPSRQLVTDFLQKESVWFRDTHSRLKNLKMGVNEGTNALLSAMRARLEDTVKRIDQDINEWAQLDAEIRRSPDFYDNCKQANVMTIEQG